MVSITPAKEIESPGASREIVWVGCNIPNGLMMECYYPVTVSVQVIAGVEKQGTEYRKDPDFTPIKLNGPAIPWGVRPDYMLKSGYAFTPVPKNKFERWVKDNTQFIISKSIVYGKTQDDAYAMAREYKDVKSGLQPLKGPTDVRIPKNPRKEIRIIEGDGDDQE